MSKLAFLSLAAAIAVGVALGGCSDKSKSKDDVRKFTVKFALAPGVKPADSQASGKGTLELNESGTALHYELEASGLADVTAVQIVLGDDKEPVASLLPKPRNGEVSGTLTQGDLDKQQLTGELKDKNLASLLDQFKASKAFILVKTKKFPNGELRGAFVDTSTIQNVTAEEREAAQFAVAAAYKEIQGKLKLPAGATAAQKTFYEDLAVLTAAPNRLAGYNVDSKAGYANGSFRASSFVENRLKAMGLEKVVTQQFSIVQPLTTQCRLEVDGKEISPLPGDLRSIYAMRHNMLQAPITPEEGIAAQAVYVGKGSDVEFGNSWFKDKIVLMDFDCGKNWLNAFAFGARAVVFIGSDKTLARNPWHHVNIPANLPRFFIKDELADSLGLRDSTKIHTLKIQAACEWTPLVGHNVIAFIPGTDPKFGEKEEDRKKSLPQTVLLAAPLDSLSEVPELSPGAREAANCAALLQIAGDLQRNRPRRNVLICFFDAQAQNHAGARAFYGAISRQRKLTPTPKSLESKLDDCQSELVFIENVKKVLAHDDIFSQAARASVGSKTHQSMLEMLREETLNFGGDVMDELRPQRLHRAQLIKDLAAAESQLGALGEADKGTKVESDLKVQIADLNTQIADITKHLEVLEKVDLEWNFLLRDLHDENITDETRPRFEQLLATARALLNDRIVELRQSMKDINSSLTLRNTFGPEVSNLVLHVSVNLGDQRKRWAIVHGDNTGNLDADTVKSYDLIYKAMKNVVDDDTKPRDSRLSHFDPQSLQMGTGGIDSRMFAPGLFVDSGAVARMFSIFNVSMMTSLDPLARNGQPGDTVEALDAATLLAQVAEGSYFLRQLMDQGTLGGNNPIPSSANYIDSEWSASSNRVGGASVKRIGGGTAMRSRAVRDSVVAIFHDGSGRFTDAAVELVPPGFDYPMIVRTNTYGIFEAGPYSRLYYPNAPMMAVCFDSSQTGSRGLISSIASMTSIETKDGNMFKASIMVFKTRLKTVVGYGFDRGPIATMAMLGQSTAPFRLDNHLLCEHENILTLFAPYEAKGYKAFNKRAWVLLNNEPTAARYEGLGMSLSDPFEHPVTALVTSDDLLALNDYRLGLLARNRIHEESLQTYSEKAREWASGANAQGEKLKTASPTTLPSAGALQVAPGSTAKYFGDLEAASALSRRVYLPLVDVMNDLVTAVVMLLLLAIPFAYALERLIIGTPHIYRQIGWFAIFFMATFGVLFLVNPAFSIAATPIIIFLAFTIILLSSLVIFIMIRKLQTEVKKMQGLSGTVHATDVSRLSTMTAAVMMGISTMRRRPLRTLLTSATVVLLTFTILTFASFGNSWGTKPTYVGPTSGVPRILVRHQLWSPITPGVFQAMRGHFADRAVVVPRYWISPTTTEASVAMATGATRDFLVTDDSANQKVVLSAAVGIDHADMELLRPVVKGSTPKSDLEQCFDGDVEMLKTDGIFLAVSNARQLGLAVTPGSVKASDVPAAWKLVQGKDSQGAEVQMLLKIGQKVLMAGRQFTFAGVIRDQFAEYNMLEGSAPLPANYADSAGGAMALSLMAQASSNQSQSEVPDQPNAQFIPYSVNKVAVIGGKQAADMNGRVRSLNIFPTDARQMQDIAQQAACVSELPTYMGDSGGVYRLIFTSLTEASGVKDLLIPVLLGGLIVFATMLGSVSDREREIYTFSSLGLAPPHVASLFFAEAAMYAVIGGMGGYLLGQVTARLLNWLGGIFDFSGVTINYSSTNAIVTVLIVMGTVLISTIYPAVKASRSANPGIQRSWKIPRPVGNLYDITFPFTVSSYDIIGVVSFLKEHFDNYSDTSLGVFATSASRIFRQKDNDMLGFGATVALAPFDLGVNQEFALLSKPSEIEGIDEVRILLSRLSGSPGDWQRANRVFINDLRKQLLIWRSLPVQVMDKYRQMTLEQWDSLPVEMVDDKSMGGSQ